MTTVIDMDYAKQIFQEIIANEGDKVLEDGCMYVDKAGAPVCIVGHMLYRLGFRFKEKTPERFDMPYMHHVQNATGFDTLSRDAFEDAPDVTFTQSASDYINTVQIRQDSGYSWSSAISFDMESLS